ncbi:MAG: hypothetical protein SCARUB_01026 [Candidatus Scalindua rubra]|uniref:Uncharacterized protein n=1 Tax=Candidatus Scalindua rubra TaxID=1872076 RepID=A0A1E3XE02_9BACT|nr:MAG: hypothetical protein SCARUB_01026 [Candidatus Scalindua rubra]
MKGGEELNTLRGSFGKALYVCAFLCIISFVSSQLNYAIAAEGDPCPKRQNEHLYWCTACEEIFTWNECGNLKYIWEFKGEVHSGEVAKHKVVPSWACLRTEYHCIRDGKKWSSNPDGIFCEGSKKCLPYNIGACEICNDDLAPKKSRAKLNFGCTKCGKEFDEPGVGHEIDRKKEYAEHLISFGNCKDCGEPLDSVCKQSGTCPHVPDF